MIVTVPPAKRGPAAKDGKKYKITDCYYPDNLL